ncbi:MAG: MarR family transcriptional regulator [Candidatus Altiarchaeota archaeon]|nr:MarR family transcriptional regulator [Candidatus Altiarchaeota archaeon]
MKNKSVGFLMMGVSLLMGFITYSFNKALTDIVNTVCSHGSDCPMWGTITAQTNISMGIIGFIFLVGLYFVFFPSSASSGKEKAKFDSAMKKLGNEEKAMFKLIIEENGTMFQSSLVEKTGLSKVKVSRLLDKLEGKGLVERKRHGMTNVVVLKH